MEHQDDKPKEICKWTYEDEPDCFWETECDNAFIFMDGTPKDNNMNYCPFCGKKLEE